jgi:hypothetical protein
MRYINALTLVSLLIPLSGCLTDSQADSVISFEVLSTEIAPANGVLENRKSEFIYNQYAFDEVVSRYSSEPVSPIDFTRNQVILLNAGGSPDGVTGIQVDSVEEQGGTLSIHATEKIAGEGCYVAATETSPYVLVKISSAARVRSVVVDREVINCNAS